MLTTISVAAIAGVLTVLSPCVLPLVPIILGAAASEHRHGPLALASGLELSFTTVGLFIATVGFAIGLDADLFRVLGGVIMFALGAVLLLPRMQAQLAVAAGPVGNWTERRLSGFSASGLRGQFAVGLLLGVVWAPCVGPTLGAASVMAARGENLGEVALTMLVFGMAAAVPLLLLGTLSREAFMRVRGRLLSSGTGAKRLLGGALLLLGLFILTGIDKDIEVWLIEVSPLWLSELTTRF